MPYQIFKRGLRTLPLVFIAAGFCMPEGDCQPFPDYGFIEKQRGKEYALARECINNGRNAEAEEHLGKSIEKNPHDPELYETYLMRATIRIDLKKYRQALADLDQVLQRANPQTLGRNRVVVYYTRALAFEGLKEDERELKELKVALEIDPKHAFSHFKLAQYYEQHGRKNEALTEYQITKNLMNDWHAFLDTKKIVDEKVKDLGGSL